MNVAVNEQKKIFTRAFVLSLCVFVTIDVFFIVYREFYNYGMNTNTISIIHIAQKYMRGNFADAINGAFAPICSWLLIPFLMFGVSPILSVYLLNIILGILLLIAVRLLSYRFDLTRNIGTLVSWMLVPIVLQFALRDHIPDLLAASSLAIYLYLIFDPKYADKAQSGSLSGLSGSFGFLCKAYILPFFMAHFLLMNLLHYFNLREKKRAILRNTVLGLAIFSIISGLWISAISFKYDQFTIGTAGEYNHRVMGPNVPDPPGASWWGLEGWRNYIRKGHPVYDQGFFAPPNETAMSIWEDFSYLTPELESWSPFGSLDNLKYYAKHVLRNIFYTVGIFEISFSLLSGAIFIGYCLLYIPRVDLKALCNIYLFPVVTILLYSSGYILLHPDERYSWILYVLILLMGGHLLTALFRNDFFTRTRRKFLTICFVSSFVIFPMRNVISAPNTDLEYWKLSRVITKFEKLHGSRVASSDHFSETLKMLFYTDMGIKYYGQARKNISASDLESDLEKYDIDYYIAWEKGDNFSKHPRFLYVYNEITNGDVPGLRIYSLKKNIN